MRRIFVMPLLLNAVASMLIPEDTEMLDGYGPISFPEVPPEDEYFEAKSLTAGPLFNSIRNKRSADYKVHESDGLLSHFRPNSVNGFSTIRKSEELRHHRPQAMHLMQGIRRRHGEGHGRKRRSADETKKDEPKTKSAKTSNGFASPARGGPSAAALVSGKWTLSPFEYSKIQHEEDSLAMDTSSVNEGMKTRTPRVNFVTQKKSLDHDETKAGATKSEFYKTPPLIHNSKEAATASSERYSERSTIRPTNYPDYNNRNRDTNRYDDRYIEDMYPPPPDAYDPMYDYRPYDSYMARSPYPEYYQSNRYDIPDYRDYPPMYGNDIDNRYYMRSDMPPPPPSPPRKRTIYYAYLPEVVRSPPTVDLRYRSSDRYDRYYEPYDYGYNYFDQPMISGSYRRPERQMIPEKPSTMRRTARPLRIQEEPMKSNSVKEKRYDQDHKYYDEVKRPIYPYSNRRTAEYDYY